MDKRINYFVTIDEDDVAHVQGFDSDDKDDYFFGIVSKVLAFVDLTGERVIEIVWHGKPVYYAGWAPGMLYQYYNKSGKLVWEGRFPEWDH